MRDRSQELMFDAPWSFFFFVIPWTSLVAVRDNENNEENHYSRLNSDLVLNQISEKLEDAESIRIVYI